MLSVSRRGRLVQQPYTRSAFEKPAMGNSPKSVQPPAHIPANPADATIGATKPAGDFFQARR